ncbi:MAG TPA: hypothetical protein VKD90_23690 [Gemmataceae bacterium]|nr:hypothetical protein [Gemmataceae bacterium]
MLKHLRQIAAGVLTVVVLARPAFPQSDEAFERFKESMAQAEQHYGHIAFRSKWIHFKSTGELEYSAQFDGFTAGPYWVTEQTTEYPPPREPTPQSSIHGSNRQYGFSLRRKAGIPVLTEVAPAFSAYQPPQCPFAVPYTLDAYHGLLGRADTRVVSRSEVAWRGRPHTEWVLDVTTGASDTRDRFPKRIGLFVRPDRPGLICGIRWYDPENSAAWLDEMVVEYEANGGLWPAPKAIEEWEADKTEWLKDKSAAYKPWRTRRYEFGLWKRRPPGPPGDEFTLSHYNLPEPKHVPAATERVGGTPRRYSQDVPPAATPADRPDPPEQPSPLAELAGAVAEGVWPWLIIGLLLVLAASVYVHHRRRAGATQT